MWRHLLTSLFILWAGYCASPARGGASDAAPPAAALETSVTAADLDPASFAAYADGVERPIVLRDGPAHVVVTQGGLPSWDGLAYGDSKRPGVRHLRIGFTRELPVGSVLTRGGGKLSVLKGGQKYPGDLNDDSQWLPAKRIEKSRISDADEVQRDEYAVWVLPPGTHSRALRLTHAAEPTDNSFAGWLGGACVLAERLANVAPQAVAYASSNGDKADRINNGTNDGTWSAWDNGVEGAERIVSPEHPEWVMLYWRKAVPLRGLGALWAGFGAAEAQAYVGPADRHPRDALDSDWKSLAASEAIHNSYASTLGANWIDFGRTVTTRAVRLRISKVTTEDHPHLKNNTRGGRRVWLGELLALQPLGDEELAGAILPAIPADSLGHPPIPVRFALAEPGTVTLVIEDVAGKRVRNLVSETPFPAGANVVWWDGTDDLGRDVEAARHGIYHVPGKFVPPGAYRVRGLWRKNIDLRYEFSVYNAGSPAWETVDHTGAWLTNHTPPAAALFVPAGAAPGGRPLMFLGSYVSEGGHGLAWVDLNGNKVGGRANVGGAWTGAPYLARDAGPHAVAGAYAYVGAAWEGELRLTALISNPAALPRIDNDFRVGEDLAVLKPNYALAGKIRSTDKEGKPALTGLAAHDGLLVASLKQSNELLFVDVAAHKALGTVTLDAPEGLAFDAGGRLLALSGRRLVRFDVRREAPTASPPPQVVVSEGLEDPHGLTTDGEGSIYISDWGTSHQVKIFSPEGKLVRAIGHAGAPAAGPYDPGHMHNPKGLSVDVDHHLWVAEEDFQPKRVSVWTVGGELVRAFYGPGEYGGGGKLDPVDKSRFYYHGMEFKLDWEKGADQLVSVLYRPGPHDLQPTDGYGTGGQPEEPIYLGGRRYFTNCYNSAPTTGTPIAMLWLDRKGIATPTAAVGNAQDWSLLKHDEFLARWPKDVDPHGDRSRNAATFAWSDLNGDGQVQPEEVSFVKAGGGGVTVMPDLSVALSRVEGRAVRLAPQRFTADGVPVYDLQKMDTLAAGAQAPTSSGGDQALAGTDGWTILTVAPKPFAPESLGGARNGEAMWSYPSLWPGLHASHESPAPDFPGELIGTTRLLGGLIRPPAGDGGPMFCVNGNMGEMYLLTQDGLFVAALFRDIRQGKSWSMPVAQRGMTLNDLSPHDENFWPSITQTGDGKVYIVDGGRSSLVRVDGLDTIRRIPPAELRVSEQDLNAAQAYLLEREGARQKTSGRPALKVAIREAAPDVDGKLDDWAGADWASIDRRGVAAFFNSNSKPYDVSAAAAVAGGRLYAAFRTGDANLLTNSGDEPTAAFKTGGALDLMIGAGAHADPNRSAPTDGDVRLLVTRVKGKLLATLYRPVAPGAKTPVPFSSPWRTITIDRVDDVSDKVQLASDDKGNFEISVPLALLGLEPRPGGEIKADLGILRGNGFQTLQRVYWSNKATGITADVPSEAMLTPQLWGRWEFAKTP
jgi:hypothetical protein